ncbi:arylformamidase [Maritalea myrionectae]|uniref:Arylformamidase n=1 Tax=Maritalea myrionectae TaxID=454601 RepID=A0A2R4MA76_9HYPH|nr:alpha/beta hydrolase [Maritalea myrionectae]AVX02947.1 arylformamidase [Maritalea myrionectae]
MRILIWFFAISAVVVGMLAFIALYPPARDQALVATNAAIADKNIQMEKNISFGPDPMHRLDIYAPSDRHATYAQSLKNPIVIFYYGGGWRMGEKSFYQFAGAALAAQGYRVVIPDYRLFPEVQFKGFMGDAGRAYQWVWEQLAEPANKEIVVMGHSAGAHMAALLAYGEQYRLGEAPRPAAMVGLAGPYSFDPTDWPSTQDIFADVDQADAARPVAFVNDNSPPSLMFHGDRDDVVKLWNQEELAKALDAHNVPHETHVLPDTGHYKILFSLSRPLREKMAVVERIKSFIDRHVDE